jgi:hypothetical protein
VFFASAAVSLRARVEKPNLSEVCRIPPKINDLQSRREARQVPEGLLQKQLS